MVGKLATALEEEQIKMSSIINIICNCFSHWNALVRSINGTKILCKFATKVTSDSHDQIDN